jgi:hypothetical protein
MSEKIGRLSEWSETLEVDQVRVDMEFTWIYFLYSVNAFLYSDSADALSLYIHCDSLKVV